METLKDSVPSRKSLLKRIEKLEDAIFKGEIVEVTHELPGIPRQVIVETVETATVSNQKEDIGWSPIGGLPEATYFMPPKDYKDSEGTLIAGMVPRNQLPPHVLQHFNNLANGNG